LNLSDKEKQNALNEVRILASIKSQHVISYKDSFFDENESSLGIIMEYADKGDLYQKITEFKKAGVFFEESDIWRILIQMVRGLKALHDLKILHRDMKSANIFLFNDGGAKLGDLNVSKVAKRGLGYTQTGTPYYASPEVWKDQPYDNKSDIWSLGCVLYEMITLKPPFRAENMEGLYKKIIGGHFTKIPERFSNDLWEILKGLLQVQPENRPNCEQLLKNPIIINRIENKLKTNEDVEDSNLLQTIRIPKNLLFLGDRLPKTNYHNHLGKKNPSYTKINDLPEIKKNTKNKKIKKEETIENKNNKDELNKEEIVKNQESIVADEGREEKENIAINSNLNLSPKREKSLEKVENKLATPKKEKHEEPKNEEIQNESQVNRKKKAKEKSIDINMNDNQSPKKQFR